MFFKFHCKENQEFDSVEFYPDFGSAAETEDETRELIGEASKEDVEMFLSLMEPYALREEYDFLYKDYLENYKTLE